MVVHDAFGTHVRVISLKCINNPKLMRKLIHKLGWTESTHSFIYIYLSCQASVVSSYLTMPILPSVYSSLFFFFSFFSFLILLKRSNGKESDGTPGWQRTHIYMHTPATGINYSSNIDCVVRRHSSS